MTCLELERELEEHDDLSVRSPELLQHLAACRGCSELVEDLTVIREQAAHMMPVAEPSGQLWFQIRDQLASEGVIRDQAAPGWLDRLGLGWLGQLRTGVSYALVFFFSLGGVYVYSVLSPSVTAPNIAAVKPEAPKLEAAAPSPSAARAADRTVSQVTTASNREVYVTNLQQVNSSIQQLQSFLASHPSDPFAQSQLSAIMQQKSRLWEEMVRWQDLNEQDLPLRGEDLP